MADSLSASIDVSDIKHINRKNSAESIYIFKSNSINSKLIYKIMNERNEQDKSENKKYRCNDDYVEEEAEKSSVSSDGSRRNASASSSSSLSEQAMDADSLDSMLKLAEYLLHDKNQEEKTISSSSRSRRAVHECLFDIKESDQRETVRLADEIDSIQEELNEIDESIKRMKQAYKSYYENFLKWVDEKDKLLKKFIDFYEEYILAKEDDVTRAKSRNNGNSKVAARIKKHSSSLKKLPPRYYSNNVASSEFGEQLNTNRKPSIVYLYNVPTENRYLPLLLTNFS
jgi:hypothetical protein